MHISGLINRFSRLSTTFRIGLVISAVTLCLVGSIVFTVMKVRGAQAEIDTHRLTGKVFLIRAIPGKRYITVMNANGTDSRVLTDEFDFALDLIWYPKSGSLGILKVADDRLERRLHAEYPWSSRKRCLGGQDRAFDSRRFQNKVF